MFYRKYSKIELISKQKSYKLVRSGAVEEEVTNIQGVRDSNAYKAGKL